MRPALRAAWLGLCLLLASAGARAELAPWDAARVTALTQELATTTAALQDSFRRQPPPQLGSPQRQLFFRMSQEVRQLRTEARFLARAAKRGADRDEMLPSYESMMETVRRARDKARRLFTTAEMEQRADAVLASLNPLRPYFEANAAPLEPVRRP